MATKEMVSQLVEVHHELELGMDTDPIAETRMRVFRNVAGHWALGDLQLPDSLDVPGVLSYDELDDLVDPCPKANAGLVYHGYTDELASAVSAVLGQFDPDSDLDVLISGTTHAVTHEATQRLSGYGDILRALGKSDEQIQEFLDASLANHDRTADDLHTNMTALKRSPAEVVEALRFRGIFLTRLLINDERDAAQNVIANKPASRSFIERPEPLAPGWRNRLRRLVSAA